MMNALEAVQPETAPARSSHGRLVATSCVGTAIEWYDFFIFGLTAPLVFDVLFFPKLDPLAGTIAVFSSFAVGFLARPLGGIFFGHYGDRIGRKSILVATIVMMGLSTAGMGLLPGYEAIGIWAPVLLVLLRFLQGFAVGGETVGALVLTVESVPQHRRGFYGSLVQAAAPLGIIAASLAVSLATRLDHQQFLDWGWRLPFLFGLALLAVGAYMRATVDESRFYAKVAATHGVARIPFVEVVHDYKRSILIVILLLLVESTYFYLTTIYAISYGARTLGLPNQLVTTAFLLANVLALVTVPLCGAIADRVGRRPVLIFGICLATCYIYPFFLLMGTQDPTTVTLAMVVAAGVVNPIVFGAEAAFVSELFDTHVRFTGASIGKQVGTVLGGGLTPLVATSLVAWSGGSTIPLALYVLVLAVPAVAVIARSGETRTRRF